MTIIAPPENVIAVQTEVGFERTLESLRIELSRHEFRILGEVNFSRELDSVIGLATTPYAVLIVWHPFAAYQALLSDPNGGLVVPFNLAVYQHGRVTTVSALNQPSLLPAASLGTRLVEQLDLKPDLFNSHEEISMTAYQLQEERIAWRPGAHKDNLVEV
jgi:uncharacterized protein (DUF302 family)